jgi:hypothetical protein
VERAEVNPEQSEWPSHRFSEAPGICDCKAIQGSLKRVERKLTRGKKKTALPIYARRAQGRFGTARFRVHRPAGCRLFWANMRAPIAQKTFGSRTITHDYQN